MRQRYVSTQHNNRQKRSIHAIQFSASSIMLRAWTRLVCFVLCACVWCFALEQLSPERGMQLPDAAAGDRADPRRDGARGGARGARRAKRAAARLGSRRVPCGARTRQLRGGRPAPQLQLHLVGHAARRIPFPMGSHAPPTLVHRRAVFHDLTLRSLRRRLACAPLPQPPLLYSSRSGPCRPKTAAQTRRTLRQSSQRSPCVPRGCAGPLVPCTRAHPRQRLQCLRTCSGTRVLRSGQMRSLL